MRTRCPHCKAIFEVQDKYVSKNVKCPKCGEPFVIVPLTESPPATICTNCRQIIPSKGQTCFFESQVVCPECDKTLRIELSESMQPSWVSWKQANVAGIGVGVFFLAVVIFALATADPKPILKKVPPSSSYTINPELHDAINAGQHAADMDRWRTMNVWTPLIFFGVSILLIVRSFRVGMSFFRGLLVFFGAALSGTTIMTLFESMKAMGQTYGPIDPAGMVGLFIGIAILGGLCALMLVFGFKAAKPKKAT